MNRKPPQWLYAGSAAILRTTFLDANGQPSVPTAITYGIIDLLGGEEVRAETEVTAAGEVDIPLTSADTALEEGQTRAHRRIILSAMFGQDDRLVDAFDVLVLAPTSRHLP